MTIFLETVQFRVAKLRGLFYPENDFFLEKVKEEKL